MLRVSLLMFVFILLLTSMLMSCSTSPLPNYYVLTANSQASDAKGIEGVETRPSDAHALIGIGPVTVPEFLQGSKMAYSLSGNTLIVSSLDLWSEPLDKAIARVLAVNVSRLDTSRSIAVFPWRKANKPHLSVQVSVTDLNRPSSGQALLDADWSIVDVRSGGILLREKFSQTLRLPSTSPNAGPDFNYAALAGAYSDLLARLSETLDVQLREYENLFLE